MKIDLLRFDVYREFFLYGNDKDNKQWNNYKRESIYKGDVDCFCLASINLISDKSINNPLKAKDP